MIGGKSQEGTSIPGHCHNEIEPQEEIVCACERGTDYGTWGRPLTLIRSRWNILRRFLSTPTTGFDRIGGAYINRGE
ncbi:hypothetical protein CEXT_479421 [Caerostris extrusa]|uniref:Uncharacterized protein n=1 Tax=Caerostris extrusa TaxID=172846 RepID=A0AAV4ME64_CAEEX|nr:hypothetical protein CEXT_479421 [Caerostris extrusa]